MGPNTRIISRPIHTIEMRVVHNYVPEPKDVLTTHHFAWCELQYISNHRRNTEYVSYLRNTICNYGIMINRCNLNETVGLSRLEGGTAG